MTFHKKLGFIFLLVCIWFVLSIQEINGQKETCFFNDSKRYCDPKLGRFVSPDIFVPNVSLSKDWNRYSYVRNNPLKYKDPDGHVPQAGGGNYPTPERLVIAGVDLSKIQVEVEEASSWNFGQMGMKGMKGLNVLNPFSGSEAHAASRGSSDGKLDFAMGELNTVYWMVHEMEARTKSRPPARSLGEIGSRVLSDLPGDSVRYGPWLAIDFGGGYLGAAAAGSLADGAGDGFFKRAWKKAKGWFSGGRKPPQPGEPGYPPRVHGGSDGPRTSRRELLLPPGGNLPQIPLGQFPEGTVMLPTLGKDDAENVIRWVFEIWVPNQRGSRMGRWYMADLSVPPSSQYIGTSNGVYQSPWSEGHAISWDEWVKEMKDNVPDGLIPFRVEPNGRPQVIRDLTIPRD